MEKIGLNQLREMFLSFFESKGHLRIPSFSLIPENDPSLLLINSGMAPMKPWFTGEQQPPRRRVCTCQKCIRTGDIENIGHTARHGTYFEMLGNFSFGDYFKKEAIAWSWEFLTKVVGLDENRLYPSVYEEDDEAFEIWNKDMGIPAERIFRFGKADNFWEHGSGPCGPCSEIYYDRGEAYGCGKPDCTVGCECDRYVEIWNNVFSQYNNDGEGHYTELAQKNIDTGMGLERLAVAVQDVATLFDVDTVMNITNRVTEMTGVSYGQSPKSDVSLRVITDHARSATMMICDGVLPSNEGRGYVLRRLLRRAARHGKLLGVNGPFLAEVARTVIQENEQAYPQLLQKREFILQVIRVEEENFARTIDGGMKILAELLEIHRASGETVFSGADAFKLYDTYGFPIDLTLEILAEENYTVDRKAFDELMEEQRTRARAGAAVMGDLAWAGIDLGLDASPTEFTGYTNLEDQGKILAMVVDGELCSTLRAGQEAVIVLDRTPLYAEMGGQTADHGTMTLQESVFVVSDVQKNKGGKILHTGRLQSGELNTGDVVTVQVDQKRRAAISRAHSATHLLQKALQNIVGDHVKQAGSLVEPDRLRFDFTSFSPVTPEQLQQIEQEVNETVLQGLDVDIREMPLEEAKKLGAMALFGEKYGDTVRVVFMGDYSMELCGGTHLSNTAKVGPFTITSESSIASGVRRIEAHVGKRVLDEFSSRRKQQAHLAELLKTAPQDLPKKVAQILGEVKEARRRMEQMQSELLHGEVNRLMMGHHQVAGLHVVTFVKDGLQADAMRQMCDEIKANYPKVVAAIASISDGKITFAVCCGKEAIARGIRAGDIVRQLSSMTGGGGGGRPDSAMGGGRDLMKLDNAMATVDEFVAVHAKGEA